MTYGRLAYLGDRDGAALDLRQGDERTYRVWAGPAGDRPETATINVYRSRTLLGRLYTTDQAEGRLLLYGALDDTERAWVFQGGCQRAEESIRAGFLMLRAAVRARGRAAYTVLLGPRDTASAVGASRGDLRLLSAGHQRARLWITDQEEARLNLYGGNAVRVRLGPVDGSGSLALYAAVWEQRDDAIALLGDRTVARLDGWTPEGSPGRRLGQLLLFDTNPEPSSRLSPSRPPAVVAVGTLGGYLRLEGPERTTHVDQRGVFVGYRPGPPPGEEGIGLAPMLSYAYLAVDEGGGYLELRGPDGEGGRRIVRLDASGVQADPDKAGGTFNWEFVAEHPTDPFKEIHYSVTEGPEVGVYVRGSVRLTSGKATTKLPEHFAHVASSKGLTAHLTPRSASSKGVAATSVTTHEIVIEELFAGTGEYDVDYLVQGVRKGRDDYQVVRPRRVHRRPTNGGRPAPGPDGPIAKEGT